jgi:hypothetical protein
LASSSCWRRASKRKGEISTTALFVSLEDGREQLHEIGRGAPGRRHADAAPAGAHGAVPRDLHLRLAEGARDEAREGHLVHGADPAELDLTADDRVDERATERQRRRLRIGRELEAGNEDAHAARGLAQGIEAARAQLSVPVANPRDDFERHRVGIMWRAQTSAAVPPAPLRTRRPTLPSRGTTPRRDLFPAWRPPHRFVAARRAGLWNGRHGPCDAVRDRVNVVQPVVVAVPFTRPVS